MRLSLETQVLLDKSQQLQHVSWLLNDKIAVQTEMYKTLLMANESMLDAIRKRLATVKEQKPLTQLLVASAFAGSGQIHQKQRS